MSLLLHNNLNKFEHKVNPLPDDEIWSKLKQIADNILKCILNKK